ncbi:MAG: hypothetical protein KDJ52_26460, partial [Anaerolineae bacterium]|nr:hypothetical protein [Anaerolineae bacterium]
MCPSDIERVISEMTAEIVGVHPEDIEGGQFFEGYGLDPVQLSRLKMGIEERYNCKLPLTLVSG